MFSVHSVLKKPVLFTVGLLAMAALLGLARAYAHFPGDQCALLELSRWRGGWPDDTAIIVSPIGTGGVGRGGLLVPWIPIVASLGLLGLRRWADALFLAAAALAPVINLGLKELAARPRPDAALALVEETGYAFPSGHAVFAAAFLGASIYVLNGINVPDGCSWCHHLRRATQGALALLILAVGASRVYLGVHWPSDVIGGFLFGALYLAALVAVRQAVATRRQGNRI